MTSQPRSVPRRIPETFIELDAHLAWLQVNLDADVDEDESAQSIGLEAVKRSRTKLALLADLRLLIAPTVEAEAAEQATLAADESVESRFKEAYGPEPLAPWQAEGR